MEMEKISAIQILQILFNFSQLDILREISKYALSIICKIWKFFGELITVDKSVVDNLFLYIIFCNFMGVIIV